MIDEKVDQTLRAARIVARLRVEVELAKNETDRLLKEFKASNPEFAECDRLKADLAVAEEDARQAMRIIHMERGDKSSGPFGIHYVSKLYYDDVKAVQWSIDHAMPQLLSINQRQFEKVARSGAADDIVQIRDEIQVTIATDLSEWL